MGWRERNTCPDGAIAQYAKALTLDFIYTSREEAIKEVGICDDEDKCNGWSDHVPIYATYAW
jgi:endonuclease/exonuclease/phosphatase family metal-dependent hydrolase